MITHMLFADDSYIYCKDNVQEASKVSNLLNVFEKATGQKVNTSKSSIFFSTNIIDSYRKELCDVLHMQVAGEDGKYLGLPSLLGRN